MMHFVRTVLSMRALRRLRHRVIPGEMAMLFINLCGLLPTCLKRT